MDATCQAGMLTHLGWNREWHWVHSSSGIPLAPGQNGEQGVKLNMSGAGARGVARCNGGGAGRPAATGLGRVCEGLTGLQKLSEERLRSIPGLT